jgi:hypothetical protein
MKLLLYSFIIFLLSACSNEEQRFVCVNKSLLDSSDGLIIKNKEATFGYLKMKLCETIGTKVIYSVNCLAKDISLELDTLSNDAVKSVPIFTKGTDFIFYKCEKIN